MPDARADARRARPNETHTFRYRDFDAYVLRVREFLDLMESDGEVFEPSNPSLRSTASIYAGTVHQALHRESLAATPSASF